MTNPPPTPSKPDSKPDVKPVSANTRAQGSVHRIALDMFFDHCLARDWERYADQPLDVFSQKIYRPLEDEPALPEHLAQIAPLIISENWLGAYRDFSMIGHGLEVTNLCENARRQ
ncbi:ACP phosphodiesterase [Pseudomonas protegens]